MLYNEIPVIIPFTVNPDVSTKFTVLSWKAVYIPFETGKLVIGHFDIDITEDISGWTILFLQLPRIVKSTSLLDYDRDDAPFQYHKNGVIQSSSTTLLTGQTYSAYFIV